MIKMINKIKEYYKEKTDSALNIIFIIICLPIGFYLKYELKGIYIGISIIGISMIIIPLILMVIIDKIKYKTKVSKFIFLYLSILLVWGAISYYLYGLNFILPFSYFGLIFTLVFYLVGHMAYGSK